MGWRQGDRATLTTAVGASLTGSRRTATYPYPAVRCPLGDPQKRSPLQGRICPRSLGLRNQIHQSPSKFASGITQETLPFKPLTKETDLHFFMRVIAANGRNASQLFSFDVKSNEPTLQSNSGRIVGQTFTWWASIRATLCRRLSRQFPPSAIA